MSLSIRFDGKCKVFARLVTHNSRRVIRMLEKETHECITFIPDLMVVHRKAIPSSYSSKRFCGTYIELSAAI